MRILPFYLVWTIALAIVLPAAGQSALFDVRVLNPNIFLNVVPGHGNEAVAYRDYRDLSFGIFVTDLAAESEHRIEFVFYAEPGVTTFDARVAWIGYTSDGQADVYVHDRTTGLTDHVTDDGAFQNHPGLFGDRLVWQDYRHGGTTDPVADVYLHDFTTGETQRVTADSAYRDLPRIHGDRIVWQDFRHAGPEFATAEIYLYDLVLELERRLTTGSTYRTYPAIFGDIVVWEDYRNGSRGDIYLYDLSRNEEIPVSTYPSHKTQPSVYGDWVVWLDYRAGTGEGDLYGYNMKSKEEYPLIVHPAHQEPPHLYEGRVVWQDFRDGRSDLMIGILSDPTDTAVEFQEQLEAAFLTVSPNPFSAGVTMSLTGRVSETTSVVIYDAVGRRIWRREVQPGDSSINWNGVDVGGRRVPPGIYVAVLEGPRPATAVIVRL